LADEHEIVLKTVQIESIQVHGSDPKEKAAEPDCGLHPICKRDLLYKIALSSLSKANENS